MGCRAELGRFPLIKDVIMNILKFDMRLQSVNNHDILKLAHVSQQRLGKNSQNTFTYYQLTNLLAGQLHMPPDTRLSIGHASTQLKSKLKLFGKKISNKLDNFYIKNIFEPFTLKKRKNELDKLHLYSQVKVDFAFEDYSLLAYVNKANFWVDSWHPYLFISRNFTDQEKNGCQFFH